MHYWLIESFVLEQMAHAMRTISAEERAKYEALMGDEPERQYAVSADGAAIINVSGVLTPTPSWLARYFGGGNTTYPQLIKLKKAAESDSTVKSLEFHFSTPGGSVDGMFAAMDELSQSSKPTRGVIHNMAASAGYGLAAQMDELVAVNDASMIGNLGVVQTLMKSDYIVEVTNTDSPKKRPDPKTKEGEKAIREELDAIFNLYAGMIATGRKATLEKVISEYGQGSTLMAKEAKKRGMIDDVIKSFKVTQKPTKPASGGKQKAAIMDLDQLKAEHPELYAAAVQVGEKKERSRVEAHLKMAETAKDLSLAATHIRSGAELSSSEVIADYQSAALKSLIESNRQSDQQQVAAGASEAAGGDGGEGEDFDDKVAKATSAMVGVTA